MSLKGKVALVTGAGRGMGKAIAIRLASEGIHVAAADIDGKIADDTSITISLVTRQYPSRQISATLTT